MARQNNEDPAVSHSHRKVASTRTDEPVGGEKGVPVNQQVWQLELVTGTAEYPEARAEGGRRRSGSAPETACDARGAEASGQGREGHAGDDGGGDEPPT